MQGSNGSMEYTNLIGLTSIGYYGDVPLEWVFNLSTARFNTV